MTEATQPDELARLADKLEAAVIVAEAAMSAGVMDYFTDGRKSFEGVAWEHRQAILDALRQPAPEQEGWREIESAPRDELSIFMVTECVWNAASRPIWNHEIARRLGGEIVHAWDHKPFPKTEANWTHWRPLPAPPAGAGK